MVFSSRYLLVALVVLLLFSNRAHAFGAGNIASISSIAGKNWRHGDIEDTLKAVTFLKHHKWSAMMIKRVYFGNWLRDYSQAMDVGTLKGCPANTIRILVWVLAFMSFGYATVEFEVTDERLSVYRPEEHIDNPRDYADNFDARQFDSRLRPPVRAVELEIDPSTGMKNYIANERGDWATSLAYVKRSFARSIEYGRKYVVRSSFITKGNEADLCEALRCLGQGLHCLEDFAAHSNYVELALRELGFQNVFPHVGTDTEIMLGGRKVYPLVTGTFGGVDFLHSVLGEATDHVTQSEVSEVEQLNRVLGAAAATEHRGSDGAASTASGLTDVLSKIPGTGELCREAVELQRDSDAKADENYNQSRGNLMHDLEAIANAPTKLANDATRFKNDAQATIRKIYPILVYRDKVVRAISSIVSMIPGLEDLIETVQERITLFVMGLLAPYIQPLIAQASTNLKLGSTTVVEASGRHQYEPWTDPKCTDPTHSLLSKDHFSNILNDPAGHVAGTILRFCAPRVIYAWENAGVPIEQVMADVGTVFHHPALRRQDVEVQQKMFATVEEWLQRQPDRGASLNDKLSSESVKAGRNHVGGLNPHLRGAAQAFPSAHPNIFGAGSHSKVAGSPFAVLSGAGQSRSMDSGPAAGSPTPPVGAYGGGFPSEDQMGQTTGQVLPQEQPYGQPAQAQAPYIYPTPTDSPFQSQQQRTFQAPPNQPPIYRPYSDCTTYPPQQQAYGGAAYPPQQGFYAPPQQGFQGGSAYPPQQGWGQQQQQQQQQQQPAYDPNNPHPPHQ